MIVDWSETRLRLQLWLHRAWPFRVIAWLHSRGVPESKGFGKFGDKERNSEDARVLRELLDTADELSAYGVTSKTDMARIRALCDEAENARLPAVLDLRAITPRAPLSPADKADRYRSGRFAEMTEEQAGLSASQANTTKQLFDDVPRKLGDKKNVMYLRADHLILDPKTDHLFTAEAAHKAFEHITCRPVPTLTPAQIALHGGITESKAFCLERAVKLYTRTKPMSDKETEKIVLEKYGSREFADFEPITTAQYEVLAQTAPLKHGRLIDSLLPDGAEELQRVKAQLADAVDILKAREAKREERFASFVIWGIVLGMLVAFVAAVAAIVFMK